MVSIAGMSQVVHLPLLTEKEGEAILSVIEEDLKLQNEEEKRIQYVIIYWSGSADPRGTLTYHNPVCLL